MSRGRCEDAVICAHLDGCLVHIIGQQADVAERVVFTFPRGADNKQSAMSLLEGITYRFRQVIRFLFRFEM